jgi:hypothetical protein
MMKSPSVVRRRPNRLDRQHIITGNSHPRFCADLNANVPVSGWKCGVASLYPMMKSSMACEGSPVAEAVT